jgi:hypothetical protein
MTRMLIRSIDHHIVYIFIEVANPISQSALILQIGI